MLTEIKTEFAKLKRYHILLVAAVGMVCSPLLQLFSQAIMEDSAKSHAVLDLPGLLELTLWGNAQIFMPVLFTLVGGYLINREYVDDTLKNLLVVPRTFRKILLGKLAAMGLLALLMGAYSLVVTVVIGLCVGLEGLSGAVLLHGLVQMLGLALGIYIVVLPILIVCSWKPGRFMGGSVLAFLVGYCCLFFKQGLLRNIYPISAVLTLIGFDTTTYTGSKGAGDLPLAVAALAVLLLLSVVLLGVSKAPGDGQRKVKTKKGNRTLRPAQREKLNVHQR